jgi:hypothetical protein
MSSLKDLAKKKSTATLTEALNEAILAPRPTFEISNVAEALAKMQKVLAKKNPNRDKMWEAFFELWLLMFSPRPREERVFHPSSFESECKRKLWYDIKGEEYSDKTKSKIDAGLMKIFDIGTMWHSYIQAMLYKAGVLNRSEVKVKSKELCISGECDGELDGEFFSKEEDVALEVKTINVFGFQKLKKEMKPLDKHIYQANVYAGVKKYSHILFLYINKDSGEFLEFMVPFDEALFNKTKGQMEEIVNAKVPPERICKTEFDTAAIGCPFATKCFE